MTYPRSHGARADLQTWATFWGPRKASAKNSPKAKCSLPLVGRTCASTRDFTEKWHPTPGLSPGKPHGQRSLVGHSPWGRKESRRLSDFTFSLSYRENFTMSFRIKYMTLSSNQAMLSSKRIPFFSFIDLHWKKIMIKYCYYILKFINWKFVFSLT